MKKLLDLGRLSRTDRRLFFQAVLFLPLIHWGLTLLGYARLQDRLEKLIRLNSASSSASEMDLLKKAQGIGRIVSAASQHGVYKATCLRRAVLTWCFLRREGIQSNICFGVRLIDHRLEAHAWVEYRGIVVNDLREVRSIFRPLEEAFPLRIPGDEFFQH